MRRLVGVHARAPVVAVVVDEQRHAGLVEAAHPVEPPTLEEHQHVHVQKVREKVAECRVVLVALCQHAVHLRLHIAVLAVLVLLV